MNSNKCDVVNERGAGKGKPGKREGRKELKQKE